MKAFASLDSFIGIPKCGKFATKPVKPGFLMIGVMLERLTIKPSLSKDLNVLNEALFVKEPNSSSCVV